MAARVLSVIQLSMALAIINLVVVAPSTRCARPRAERFPIIVRTRSSSGCSWWWRPW
jgi:hypothetical protein